MSLRLAARARHAAATPAELRPVDAGTQLDEVADWLGLDGAAALQGTFPQLYAPGADSQRLGLFHGAQLCAHLAYQDRDLHGPLGRARLRLVGGVATAPAARGQGHARRLLEELSTRSRTDGLDALLLWSDLPEFYARFGFVAAGLQHSLRVPAQAAQACSLGVVRPARDEDLSALLALHEAKPLRIARDLPSFAQLCRAAPMRIFVLERRGEILAYACYEKGGDFRGWWHELGGPDEAALALVRGAMAREQLGDCMLLLPEYRHRLLRALPGSRHQAEAAGLRLALSAAGQGPLFVDGLDSV